MTAAYLLLNGGIPRFVAAPRAYVGNMCAVRVADLPAIPGGARDPSLVLSWFIDRYQPSDRQRIYADWKKKKLLDVLVSWPDSQDYGYSPAQFRQTCIELIQNGFRPCVMLSAKPTSSANIRTVYDTLANIELVLPLLVGLVPRFCIGWELALWLTPQDVQFLIDQLAPQIKKQPGSQVFVHFRTGYGSFQVSGPFANFWNPNIGKLDGLFHEKILEQTPEQYWYDSGGIVDILIRFSGQAGCSPDRGDGTPFSFVALEITAQTQYDGETSEAQGDELGSWAMAAPSQTGPTGVVAQCDGSGNGYELGV